MVSSLMIKKLFFGSLLFFLVFGGMVLLFAAVGLFYPATIMVSIAAGLVFAWKFLPKFGRGVDIKNGKLFVLVALLSLAISLANCHFATPTVFGGRDQGAIATAAIYLSKNHNLRVDLPVAHDLFQKYGPGHALNFPGFDYQKDGSLVSRFPLGYTSYLAAYYNLLGLKGTQYANFIPLFFFLAIFWLILSEIFTKRTAFFGFLVAASFFPFLWFAKYALTETYMLFLVWAGIYFLLLLRNAILNKHETVPFYTFTSLAFFALSSLVRIEGIVFFILAVIYILFLQRKKMINVSLSFNRYLLISTVFLIIIYIYLNFPDLLDSAKNIVKAFLPNSTKESAPSPALYSFMGRIFFSYNVLPYLLLGLIGIVWLLTKFRKNWKETEYLPLLIVFPTFFYLFSPMITLDDPWFLRRFVFAVFPALILYSIYALEKFFYHKIFLYFVLSVLIVANSFISWRYFTLSESRNLLPQIEKISRKFSPDDLILVDRLASGSGFSLMSEPMATLYNRQAVYFFNAGDLKYVNQNRYKNIYLIAELEQNNSWFTDLVKDKNPQSFEVISNNFLEPSDKKYGPAVNVESQVLTGIWKIK